MSRRSWPAIAIVVTVVAAIGVLAYLLLRPGDGGPPPDPPGNAVAPVDRIATAPPSTIRDRPEAEQLAAAFRAVFGRDGPVPRTDLGGEGGTERASRVLWTSFGPVLLTESRLPDGCHACVGYIGVYYLRDTGIGFEAGSRHPEAVPGAGWGEPPQGWRIVDNFTTHPAIYAEGGYTGQGYTQTWASIVELRPDGPVASRVDLGSDNGGAVGDGPGYFSLEGQIRNVIRNRSFDVIYTGSCNVTRRYIWRSNRFESETGGEVDSVTCPGMEGSQ